MKRLLPVIFLLSAVAGQAQSFQPVTLNELLTLKSSKPDTLTIINFWATWCKPCVEEMPYFEELDKGLDGMPIRVIFVSVDAEKRWESNLDPFLERHQLQAEVWGITADKPFDWIDQITTEWSGAIPATIMLLGEEFAFYEKSFNRAELHKNIRSFIKQ
jgi:thiol-disulfide isomerase/thioredoxin